MDLFGFDLNRLQVTAPDAVQDLGGVLGDFGGAIGNIFGEAANSDLAKTLWKPVSYFLPEVRINPQQSAGRPVQNFGQPISSPKAQPAFMDLTVTSGTALMIGGALLLVGVLIVKR